MPNMLQHSSDLSELSAGPYDGCYDIQIVLRILYYTVHQPRQASPVRKMPFHNKARGIVVATLASDGVHVPEVGMREVAIDQGPGC